MSDLIVLEDMCWNGDLVDSIFEEEEAALIKGIPLLSSPQEDRLVWEGERSRVYSIHNGYRILMHSVSHPFSNHAVFKQIWKVQCPPKIKIATWKFVHGFVATRECLFFRKIAPNPFCPRCNVERESTNHVLRVCVCARNVWVMLGYPVHV